MQSPPIFKCTTPSSVTLRRMLSSSSCSSPNPKPNPNTNPRFSFPVSENPQTPLLHHFSNLNPPQNFHQSRNANFRYFSTAVSTQPGCSIPISNPKETRTAPSLEIDVLLEKSLVVVSFYKFADFPDHADMRTPLKDLCEEVRVSGGIILAPEGINGSICGTRESVEKVIGFIQADDRLKGLRQIESPVSPEEEAIHHGHTSKSPLGAGEDAPFRWDHVRVKLKKEIVSLGLPTISPIEKVGKYVNPREWNDLINDPDTVVIDVRNAYETRIGKFKGAIDPHTKAFREFPSWVDKDPQLSKTETPPKIAMYCTGGIRCEKASSFLLDKGFKEVYHLKGGILKYLEEVPKNESLWEGECFVFDKRVSVEHGLVQGTFKLCYGCKQPVSDKDMEAEEWEEGVSCLYCFESKSEEEKDRARARQKQFQAWGVIGGPDKGRKPSSPKKGSSSQVSSSI